MVGTFWNWTLVQSPQFTKDERYVSPPSCYGAEDRPGRHCGGGALPTLQYVLSLVRMASYGKWRIDTEGRCEIRSQRPTSGCQPLFSRPFLERATCRGRAGNPRILSLWPTPVAILDQASGKASGNHAPYGRGISRLHCRDPIAGVGKQTSSGNPSNSSLRHTIGIPCCQLARARAQVAGDNRRTRGVHTRRNRGIACSGPANGGDDWRNGSPQLVAGIDPCALRLRFKDYGNTPTVYARLRLAAANHLLPRPIGKDPTGPTVRDFRSDDGGGGRHLVSASRIAVCVALRSGTTAVAHADQILSENSQSSRTETTEETVSYIPCHVGKHDRGGRRLRVSASWTHLASHIRRTLSQQSVVSRCGRRSIATSTISRQRSADVVDLNCYCLGTSLAPRWICRKAPAGLYGPRRFFRKWREICTAAVWQHRVRVPRRPRGTFRVEMDGQSVVARANPASDPVAVRSPQLGMLRCRVGNPARRAFYNQNERGTKNGNLDAKGFCGNR